MGTPQIAVLKPGSVSDTDKTSLREAGIVIVEMENPDDFRLITPEYAFDSGMLLKHALKALCMKNDSECVSQRSYFVKLLNDTLNQTDNVAQT